MGLGPMPAGVPGGGLPPQPGAGAPPGGAPGGGMPPANLGPHTIPQGNPGNVMQSLQKIQQAVQLMQEALPQIPMGTPLHQKLIKVVSDMTKELGDVKSNLQQQVQTLMQHMQQQKAAGAQPPPGMMPPQPNQPPAMTPPGAGAGMAA